MEFWCDSASIPRIIIGSQTVYRYGIGLLEKKPVFPQFTDMSMTILSDAQTKNWEVFHHWTSLTINRNMTKGIKNVQAGVVNNIPVEPFEVGYKDDYAVDVSIQVYDDAGHKVKRITLRQAYPIMVGEMQLGWHDKSRVAQIPVTFTYIDYFTEFEENYNPAIIVNPI